MSNLVGIAIRLMKRGPMQSLDRAAITKQRGVANDFRGKAGKRQVTVLNQKSWLQACADLNQELDWTTRRANLLVDDLDLYLSAGKVLQIGAVRLLITGETDPCSRMNAAVPGLYDALFENWRGGVCCRVVAEGEILINDKVELIE